MRRFGTGLGALAMVLAMVSLAPGGASAASAPLGWSSPELIAGGQPFSQVIELDAVSCPSSSLCVAVDNDGGVVTTDPTAAAPAWSGHEAIDGSQVLTSVSCVPATTMCAAVDDEDVTATTDAGASPATWSTPQQFDPQDSMGSVSISCPSTSLCVAVDGNGNAFKSPNPFSGSATWYEQPGISGSGFNSVSCGTTAYCVAVTSDGHAWITDDPTDAAPTWTQSAAAIDTHNPDLRSVSCVSTTLCVAVDDAGDAVETTDPTSSPSAPTWTPATPIDGTTALLDVSCTSAECAVIDGNGNALASTNGAAGPWASKSLGGVLSVSCVGSAACVAVGEGGGPQTYFTTNPNALSPTWSSAVLADGFNTVLGMSCPPGAGFCAALDGGNRVDITGDPGAADPTWTPSAVLDPGIALEAISCADAKLCVVVDNHNNELYSTDPTAGSPTWSSPVAMGDGLSEVEAVDCPADDLCVADDAASDVLVSQDPASSSNWTKVAAVEGPLSCAGTSMCMVVQDFTPDGSDDYSVVTGLTTDTPTASTPVPIDPTGVPSEVACPSTTLCVVGDYSGDVLTTSDPENASPTFSSPHAVDPNGAILSLACPSASLCVAGDYNGLVAMSADPADASAAWPTAQVFTPFDDVEAISCASAQQCAAGDEFGNGAIGTPPVFTLTVNRAGTGSGTVVGGGITCPRTCSASETGGQSVTLTASAAPGSTFAGWSGGGCSGTGTCSVTLSADTIVTATFNESTPKLACTLKLKSTKVVLPPSKRIKHAKPVKNAGTITATATCNQAAKGTVSGSVSEAASKKKPKHGAKTYKLSSVKVTLVAGKAATVTIKLPSSALKALATKASESVSMKLAASGSGGPAASATASGKLR